MKKTKETAPAPKFDEPAFDEPDFGDDAPPKASKERLSALAVAAYRVGAPADKLIFDLAVDVFGLWPATKAFGQAEDREAAERLAIYNQRIAARQAQQ